MNKDRKQGKSVSLSGVERKSKLRRHKDHAFAMQDGTPFAPLFEPLRTLWFDRKICDSKVKLIMMMLSHATDFHIRNDYLRKRFSPKSLTKFLPEIIQDGIIRREEVWIDKVKHVVYHTNPLSEWKLRELVEAKGTHRSPVNSVDNDAHRSQMNGGYNAAHRSPTHRSLGNGVNNTNSNNRDLRKNENSSPQWLVGNSYSSPERAKAQPANLVKLVEISKKIEFHLRDDDEFPDWEHTNMFCATRIDDGEADSLLDFIEWLPQFMAYRKSKGLKYRRSVPWDAKLASAWQAWRSIQEYQDMDTMLGSSEEDSDQVH